MKDEFKAYLFGLLGICGFGLTLPATKAAIPLFGVIAVGVGRAIIPGILSLLLLTVTKSKKPTPQQARRLITVALGIVFGFPLFSAYAMKSVPASHGAIVVGLVPLFTALFAVIFAKEKPSLGYWISGLVGSSAIVLYSIYIGGGILHIADIALLFAVISAAFGYAEGARLAKEMGSWRVICYALVFSLPIAIPLFFSTVTISNNHNVLSAWIGFLYVSLISMFLAFFVWYKALEMGGIAKMGQLQLIQPFVTIFASAILFSEQMSGEMFLVLAIVLTTVHFGRKSKVICSESI
jgi:drug/metabolite transporter (DMT)-like permease